MKLSGNTILITGGATGIGLAMAEGFLQRGNKVAICGRRQDKLDAARELLPQLQTYACDVSIPAQRQQLHGALQRDGMLINVLINNAAVMRHCDLISADPAHPDRLDMDQASADIATNLLAPIALNQLFLPLLMGQPDPVIINVTSPGGVVPVWNVPLYCASKAALNSYSKSLRYQLGERVAVIELFPPSVDTKMMDRVKLHKISSSDFTKALFTKLERGGDVIWVGEGRYLNWINRLSPALAYWIISRSIKT